MELLPIFYGLAYLLVAASAYVCFSVVAGHDTLGKRLFVAILGFGASAYVGFFAVVLSVSASPLRSVLDGQTRAPAWIAAYVVPGLLGCWISLKVFEALRKRKTAKSSIS